MITYTKDNLISNIIKGISIILLFFAFSLFKTLPLELLHIKYANLTITFKEIYNITAELILIAAIVLIFRKEYKKAIEDIKINHMSYFSKNFKFYLIGVFIMMSTNYLISILGGGISENETAIRDEFSLYPVYTYIASVFLAPFLEESVFRLGFRAVFKNKIIYILASGLIFGSLHLISSFDSPLVLLHLISYSSCGIMFAYIMTRTNNILVSTGFHFMHNGILMSLQVLTLLLA